MSTEFSSKTNASINTLLRLFYLLPAYQEAWLYLQVIALVHSYLELNFLHLACFSYLATNAFFPCLVCTFNYFIEIFPLMR